MRGGRGGLADVGLGRGAVGSGLVGVTGPMWAGRGGGVGRRPGARRPGAGRVGVTWSTRAGRAWGWVGPWLVGEGFRARSGCVS